MGEALAWYVRRVRRVLDEDPPLLTPFDFDAAAEEGAYIQRGNAEVVGDVSGACQQIVSLARAITPAELELCGVGSDGSPRSAAMLLARADRELVHHELDLRRGVGRA